MAHPEDRRSPPASYRFATSVVVVLLAFGGAIGGGAAVDVLFQPLLSFAAISITAFIIARSMMLYPSMTTLLLCMLMMVGANVLATQFIARELHYAPELGSTLWRVAGLPLYPPLAWSSWVRQFGPEAAPLTFGTGMVLAYGGLILGVLLTVCLCAAVRLDSQRASAVEQP